MPKNCPNCKSDSWKSAELVVLEGSVKTGGQIGGSFIHRGKLTSARDFLLSDRWFTYDFPIELELETESTTGLVNKVKDLMISEGAKRPLPMKPSIITDPKRPTEPINPQNSFKHIFSKPKNPNQYDNEIKYLKEVIANPEKKAFDGDNTVIAVLKPNTYVMRNCLISALCWVFITSFCYHLINNHFGDQIKNIDIGYAEQYIQSLLLSLGINLQQEYLGWFEKIFKLVLVDEVILTSAVTAALISIIIYLSFSSYKKYIEERKVVAKQNMEMLISKREEIKKNIKSLHNDGETYKSELKKYQKEYDIYAKRRMEVNKLNEKNSTQYKKEYDRVMKFRENLWKKARICQRCGEVYLSK